MTSMDAGGFESLARRVTTDGRRPVAGDYKGAQPPYRADKRPEGALSARDPQRKIIYTFSLCASYCQKDYNLQRYFCHLCHEIFNQVEDHCIGRCGSFQ